jgi:hypothetical protein
MERKKEERWREGTSLGREEDLPMKQKSKNSVERWQKKGVWIVEIPRVFHSRSLL